MKPRVKIFVDSSLEKLEQAINEFLAKKDVRSMDDIKINTDFVHNSAAINGGYTNYIATIVYYPQLKVTCD